ncbi:hypothetical protein B7755_047250 [Streptomyces sp. NBS 14/10]|nr:hypothetical protein [Streptomyces sp. NBS 14/10]KAK1185027.1 hypothetical protein B7755_047250 [Streptomyces sp. NBS 14/10]
MAVADRASQDHTPDPVAVGEGPGEPFQGEQTATLAEDRRFRRHPIGPVFSPPEAQAHATGESDRTLPPTQTLGGGVDGGERGHLGGVDREARAGGAEEGGDRVGDGVPIRPGRLLHAPRAVRRRDRRAPR